MKARPFSLLALMTVGSALAGPVVTQPPPPAALVAPAHYFRDQELFFDLYGSYLDRTDGGDCNCTGDDHSGGGGGVAIGNYFTPFVGARADVNFSSLEEARAIIAADLMFRYLFRDARLAPYVFVGGGVEAVSGAHGFVRLGGGLEFRLARNWGLFAEGSYAWVSTDESAENLLIKVGVRVVY